MRWLLAVVVCTGACTPRALTPPSRSFVMDSPTAPEPGGTDVQLDAGPIGTMLWGPDLTGGNARVRHTVEPGVSIEADAGVLHVMNEGEGGDRNGYTGRLGVLLQAPTRRWAVGAGLGGGTSSTAGNWGSADVHGMVSGTHRYARPMFGAGAGYSAPFGEKTFVVRMEDPTEGDVVATLRLPRNAFAHMGVGLELGPPDKAFILSASVLRFWRGEDSVVVNNKDPGHIPRVDETLLALGIGVRLAIQ